MKKGNILIVDDKKIVLLAMKKELEHAGHKVTISTDAKEAVELAGKEEFDIVITDLVMPDMNGVEICKKIKELLPKAEVILMSGFHGYIQKYKNDFLKAGGREEYLRKPMLRNELTKKVHVVLEELSLKRS